MADRSDILSYCDERLRSGDFRDAAVNGLQVAGAIDIQRVAVAVSASIRTLTAAGDWAADTLLVHHGLLWGANLSPLTGILAERLRNLFQNDMNLIAYHLPLDGHEEIGNNALLADACGYRPVGRFAEVSGPPLGVIAEREPPLSLGELCTLLAERLERGPVVVGPADPDEEVRRIGIVSGSGYSALAEAAGLGCDALLTGDIREPTMAEARELGVNVIAAGHEATERFGVQALAAELAERFDLETRYVHDPNPV